MRCTALLAPALALALPACGGLASSGLTNDPHARDAGSDAAESIAPVPPPPPAVDAAPPLVLRVGEPDASPIALFDAGQSPCEAAGGKCLELIPCDGFLTSAECGWSAACCMPNPRPSPPPPPFPPPLGGPP